MAVVFQSIQPPAAVLLSLKDHRGGLCRCTLQKGQPVLQGQPIGIPQNGGAAVHASVSGTVRAVSASAVVIENDFRNTPAPDCVPLEDLRNDAMAKRVSGAGLLTAEMSPLLPTAPCRFLALSLLRQDGAEPDPLQLYGVDRVFGGLRLARQLWKPEKTVIFWDRRCRSSGVLAKSFGEDALLLPTDSRYPGSEPRMLRRKLWSLGLTQDCLILNAAGTAGLYEAVWLGQPWIRRPVVFGADGAAAMVPLGTSLGPEGPIVEKTAPTLMESSCNLTSRIVG